MNAQNALKTFEGPAHHSFNLNFMKYDMISKIIDGRTDLVFDFIEEDNRAHSPIKMGRLYSNGAPIMAMLVQ